MNKQLRKFSNLLDDLSVVFEKQKKTLFEFFGLLGWLLFLLEKLFHAIRSLLQ